MTTMTAQDVVQQDLEYICGGLSAELKYLEGKKLLITGGAGFLGYYLMQAALHWNRRATEPIRVIIYDSFVRGVPQWLTNLEGDPHLCVTRHDMTEPLPPSIGRFDYIMHAASVASPTYYRTRPIETMDANVNGLRALLDFARGEAERERPIEGFVFFSSSEIYGDPTTGNIPTPETYRGYVSCTGPRACYDEAKRYGEALCVNFAKYAGVPVTMVRPFNNYGPGLKITDRRVLPDFARDIIAGRDIVMLSDGSPRRTFCYVADAVVGYYKALVKGRRGEPYNIGVESPEISIAELADKVVGIARELFGYTGNVILQASPDQEYLVDNPNRRCPVIAKAREELGYEPSVSLDEGLRRSLIWYSANPQSAEA